MLNAWPTTASNDSQKSRNEGHKNCPLYLRFLKNQREGKSLALPWRNCVDRLARYAARPPSSHQFKILSDAACELISGFDPQGVTLSLHEHLKAQAPWKPWKGKWQLASLPVAYQQFAGYIHVLANGLGAAVQCPHKLEHRMLPVGRDWARKRRCTSLGNRAHNTYLKQN
jgi:hypothetical protein